MKKESAEFIVWVTSQVSLRLDNRNAPVLHIKALIALDEATETLNAIALVDGKPATKEEGEIETASGTEQ